MYSFALCDDQTEELNIMSKKINKILSEYGISTECIKFSTPEVLIEKLKSEKIDVLFLDIDMPTISGMDIAGFINENSISTLVVFVTAYDMLVYDTFRYRPFGFIRKSHFDNEMDFVISQLLNELSKKHSRIIFHKGNIIITETINDIIYIEAEGNYVNIVKSDEISKFRETLSNILIQSGEASLIRVHKGYIINPDYIKEFKGDSIKMTNNDIVPIGRSYEKEVKHQIIKLLRG